VTHSGALFNGQSAFASNGRTSSADEIGFVLGIYTLQHHCNALQRTATATHCNSAFAYDSGTACTDRICFVLGICTLQHTATMLQYTATHCSKTATHCVQHTPSSSGERGFVRGAYTLQHAATRCNTLQLDFNTPCSTHALLICRYRLCARCIHTSTSCNTLQQDCNTLNTLQHIAAGYKTLQLIQHAVS